MTRNSSNRYYLKRLGRHFQLWDRTSLRGAFHEHIVVTSSPPTPPSHSHLIKLYEKFPFQHFSSSSAIIWIFLFIFFHLLIHALHFLINLNYIPKFCFSTWAILSMFYFSNGEFLALTFFIVAHWNIGSPSSREPFHSQLPLLLIKISYANKFEWL